MTTFVRRVLAVASVGILIAAGGCGQSVPFNKRVEGVVTLDGKPVPNAHVRFIPVTEEKTPLPTSYGVTDDSGNFKMAADKKPGAAIAKHKVVFMQGRMTTRGSERAGEAPNVVPDVILPGQYTSASGTPLEVEVTADKHHYEFQLTSKVQ